MTTLTTSPPAVRRGAQRPRIDTGPRSSRSSGPEVVELARGAGLILDDWQAYVLERGLAETEDGQWAALEVGLIVPRQNGKSALLAALLAASVTILGENQVMASAHEFKTCIELFRSTIGLFESHPDLDRRIARVLRGHGNECIELKSGSRIRFVARSRGSGRGFSADRVIFDEAFRLSPEMVGALLPTMSARPNPQVWYASSAPWADSEQLHAVRRRGLRGDSSSLILMEWSAEPDDDPSFPSTWAQANPSLGSRVREAFVESEREAMPAGEFARERLGIPDDEAGGTAMDMALWERCWDGSSKPGRRVSFGVDVTEGGAAISVASRRPDGKVHVETIEHIDGRAWVVPRLVELHRRHRAVVALDPGAGAGSLLADLEGAGVEVAKVSTRELAQACGAFAAAIDERTVAHIGQASLTRALGGARRRPVENAWTWSRATSTADVAPLVAATLAFWQASAAPKPSKARVM